MGRALHILLLLLIGVGIVSAGTAGYMFVEGWGSMDSLFMTITTLSTVGYSEVHKLTAGGRILSMALILLGVGYFFYAAGSVVQFMLEGQIRELLGRRRLEKKIERLRDHYIVCGYGRIGRVVCRNIIKKPLDVVVIEKSETGITQLEKDGILHVKGDVSEEANLLKAGILRAKGLVAVLGSDVDNVFLVLTARQLNAKLQIVARATGDSAEAKLRAAGADWVESPYDIGATSMAHRILRPTVTGFLDLALSYRGTEIQMEEMLISPASPLVNIMLKDSGIRQKYDLIIIAVKSSDGKMNFNPSFETVLKQGDTVVALGGEKNLRRFEEILNPRR